MLIRIDRFAGIRPKVSPRLLGDAEATAADNCRLYSGKLKAWRLPTSTQAIGTNSLRYSNAFDNAAWTKTGTTVTANAAVAPDGSTTADKIVETAVTSAHIAIQSVAKLAAAESWCFSVSLDSAERTFAYVYMGDNGANFARCIVNLSTGAITSSLAGGTYSGVSYAAVADGGYWRVSIIATTGTESTVYGAAGPASNSTTFSYLGTLTNGIYATCASLRKATAAGTYRETYATALPYIKSIFLYKDQYWFASSAVSHWIPGPIKGNTTDAIYFTGGTAALPSVTYDPIAYSGNNGRGDMPRQSYTMGLPAPSTAVSVASSAQTGSVTSVASLITSKADQTTSTFSFTGVTTDGYPLHLKGRFVIAVTTTTAKLLTVALKIMRGAVVVAQLERKYSIPVAATENIDITIDGEDAPSAGTHSYDYSATITANDAGSFSATYAVSEIRAYYSKVRIGVGGGHPFRIGDHITVVGVGGFEAVNQEDMEIVQTEAAHVWVDVVKDETYTSGGTWTRAYIAEEVQDTGWVMTFLTQVGDHVQEGPPSPVSELLAIGSGEPVSITAIPTTPPVDGGTYNITGKRLYRSNVDSSGSAAYQFVADLAVGDTTYTDSKRFSELGEVLPSETWVKPPANMLGLTEMYNGVLAGISSNQVCLSEPFQPHAWPTEYRKSISYTPRALCAFGENLLVATEGPPSLIVGYDPGSMRTIPVELKSPCMSARSMVDMGDYAAYAGDDGIVLVSSGERGTVTEQLFTREEWKAINASTVIGAEYNGSYVGFYTELGTERGLGFVFDPKSQVSMWTPLDFGADAAWTDPKTGDLYIVRNETIYKWDADDGARYPYRWRSRRFVAPRPCNPAFGRVLASEYPVLLKLFANPDPKQGDDMVQVMMKSVQSSAPFTLPGNYLANAFEIELSGVQHVNEVAIASSVREITGG